MSQLFTNNARSLLVTGISDTATSMTIESAKADLFPIANTGTGSVPATATDWFKAVLQDALGNVEIVYVRTRTAGSAIFSDILRGQEGTTARTFSAGVVVGLRITATDVQNSIAAAGNAVQLTGDQTVAGNKTFSGVTTFSQTAVGSVSGNAGTVTNGVYTTGDQTVGGTKTFSSAPVSANGFVLSASGWKVTEAAGVLYFAVNNVNKAKLDSSGNLTVAGNVTAYGTI